MKALKPKIARIIFFAYLAAVLVLCFGDFSSLPEVQPTLWGIPKDKIAHFCMFFPFPVLAFLAFDKYTEKVWQSFLFVTVIFAVGGFIAAATEFGQSLTDYRSGDILDFAADVLALSISSVIVLIIDISQMKNISE